MRIERLRTRLILLLVGLLALVLSAVFVAVYNATDSSAERQARQQLQVGANVFSRLLELRAQELASATQVLAADFGFREAVASGDLPTIRSALLNQARRIGADEALFFDAQGDIQVSSRMVDDSAQVELSALQPLGDNSLVAVIDGQPFLLVDAVVMAPLAVGQVAMAFGLNQELAEEMRTLTGLEVSFVTSLGGATLDRVGTLPVADGVEAQETPASGLAEVGSKVYLATRITLLEQQGFRIKAQLLSPLEDALAIFDILKRELVLITLIALALSSVAAYVMAGSLSRPVRVLADAARRIGQGNYTGSVKLKRSDELGRLAESIDTMRKDIAEREQQIAHNAFHDPLTGLANLAKVHERLSDTMIGGGRGALVLFYLADAEDLLKAYGQSFYAEIIATCAERIRGTVGASALLAFHPGQGFLLVLPGVSRDEAMIATDKLVTALSGKMQKEGAKLTLEWLAGLVDWSDSDRNPDELLRQVAIAASDARPGRERISLYQAKRDQDYMRRLRLIRDIHFAAQKRELSVVYQPKLDIATGEVRQVEALMRWQHSELGFIGPDEFITLAEQTGSIHKLTQWILMAIASQIGSWTEKGLHLQVAMNISALDLENERFPDQIRMILEAQGISPSMLSFEVTESALMIDPERSLRSLERLRALGFSLAVDDYGTGYSSLAMLKSLPVQDLKIDKSFVLQLAEGSEDAVIVRSTIELAHNMGLKVIAEGVENAVSLEWLRALGCDTAQGYFISRPIAALDLEAWLEANRTTYKQMEHS